MNTKDAIIAGDVISQLTRERDQLAAQVGRLRAMLIVVKDDPYPYSAATIEQALKALSEPPPEALKRLLEPFVAFLNFIKDECDDERFPQRAKAELARLEPLLK